MSGLITHEFDNFPVARAWPVEITCSGEFDVTFDDDGEWVIGQVRICYYRLGEHVLDVVPRKARAQRIRNWAVNHAFVSAAIDEKIGAEIESRAVLAAESRWREAREAV